MIVIEQPGPQASVQDLGRTGYRDLGVGRSGAADRAACRLANRLVGNPETAAVIEFLLGGGRLRLQRAATVALTGARCAGGTAWNCPLSLPAGSVIRLGSPPTGLRSYLAVRGGVAVTPVLGSCSTDTLSGLGPALLQPGDQLPIGTAAERLPSPEATLRDRPAGPLRIIAGPRTDWFADGALAALTGTSWLVLPASDRIGTRLDGPPLRRLRSAELPPEPTLPGAIQLPPDGRPIVLGPDAPVTGGYPVIAVVRDADTDRLAQLRPGDRVRFATSGPVPP